MLPCRTSRHLIGTPMSDLRDQERLPGRSEVKDGDEWNSGRGMGMLVSAPHGEVVALVLAGVRGSNERVSPSICLVPAWDLTQGSSRECMVTRLPLPSSTRWAGRRSCPPPPRFLSHHSLLFLGLGQFPLQEPSSDFPLAPGNIRCFFKLV